MGTKPGKFRPRELADGTHASPLPSRCCWIHDGLRGISCRISPASRERAAAGKGFLVCDSAVSASWAAPWGQMQDPMPRGQRVSINGTRPALQVGILCPSPQKGIFQKKADRLSSPIGSQLWQSGSRRQTAVATVTQRAPGAAALGRCRALTAYLTPGSWSSAPCHRLDHRRAPASSLSAQDGGKSPSTHHLLPSSHQPLRFLLRPKKHFSLDFNNVRA